MSLLSQSTPVTSYKLVARTNNINSIMRTLQVVNFKEFATIAISDTSIKVTVEDMRCLQSTAYINALLFEDYEFRNDDDPAEFRVNLNHLVACLMANSKNETSLKMSYRGNGFPLELILDENGKLTDCSLKTFPPDDLVNFSISDPHNRITLGSDLMKLVLREIDPTSEIIELGLSSDSRNFSVTTAGAGGQGQIEINQADGAFGTFECPLTVSSSFKLAHVKMAFKPLSLFQTLCIRIDNEGLLRLQFRTQSESMRNCVAEFFVSPLLE